MSAARRVGFTASGFLMLSLGVTAVFSQLTAKPADAYQEKPSTSLPDPVVIREGQEITWRGVVCDVWSCGCRLRQTVTSPDGRRGAIAPAVVFTSQNDTEKARQAWGQELEAKGVAKGGTITVVKVTGGREGYSAD